MSHQAQEVSDQEYDQEKVSSQSIHSSQEYEEFKKKQLTMLRDSASKDLCIEPILPQHEICLNELENFKDLKGASNSSGITIEKSSKESTLDIGLNTGVNPLINNTLTAHSTIGGVTQHDNNNSTVIINEQLDQLLNQSSLILKDRHNQQQHFLEPESNHQQPSQSYIRIEEENDQTPSQVTSMNHLKSISRSRDLSEFSKQKSARGQTASYNKPTFSSINKRNLTPIQKGRFPKEEPLEASSIADKIKKKRPRNQVSQQLPQHDDSSQHEAVQELNISPMPQPSVHQSILHDSVSSHYKDANISQDQPLYVAEESYDLESLQLEMNNAIALTDQFNTGSLTMAHVQYLMFHLKFSSRPTCPMIQHFVFNLWQYLNPYNNPTIETATIYHLIMLLILNMSLDQQTQIDLLSDFIKSLLLFDLQNDSTQIDLEVYASQKGIDSISELISQLQILKQNRIENGGTHLIKLPSMLSVDNSKNAEFSEITNKTISSIAKSSPQKNLAKYQMIYSSATDFDNELDKVKDKIEAKQLRQKKLMSSQSKKKEVQSRYSVSPMKSARATQQKTLLLEREEEELKTHCTFRPTLVESHSSKPLALKTKQHLPKGYKKSISRLRQHYKEAEDLKQKEQEMITGANYNKQSKNLMNVKPPNITDPSQIKRIPLFYVDVALGKENGGRKGRVAYYDGDEPEVVARNFCKAFSMGIHQVGLLKLEIEACLEQLYEK